MNVLIYVVNYRADRHLLRFIESVRAAMAQCRTTHTQLYIHDNSEKSSVEQTELVAALGEEVDWIHVNFSPRNDGYFGGLGQAQTLVQSTTDCVIFCNPDLTVATDFFVELQACVAGTKGILAPSIASEQDGFDQNPKYVERLSQRKLARLSRVYSNDLTYAAFQILARIRELLPAQQAAPSRAESTRIYAPHGSLFIFADVGFFKRLPPYPCFLFGEELFVAEEARLQGVPILYQPRLRVSDVRHASIRLLGTRFRRKLMLQSVRFVLEKYYQKERLDS